MVTNAQIAGTLNEAHFEGYQLRALGEAFEMTQRKTQEEVETSLRNWMENRFATKEDLERKFGELRVEIERSKSETIKWAFIFWATQLGAVFAMLKLLK